MRTQERDEWTFDIAASELKTKCEEKVEHHKDRVAYWDGQHKELRESYVKSVKDAAQNATEKEAKEAEDWAKAVDYLETDQFALAGNRVSKVSMAAPNRREIMGDPEIYQELQQALIKLNDHKNNVEAFSRWSSLLDRKGDEELDVTYDDAVYFGL